MNEKEQVAQAVRETAKKIEDGFAQALYAFVEKLIGIRKPEGEERP